MPCTLVYEGNYAIMKKRSDKGKDIELQGATTTRKRGRPATGKGAPVVVRMQPAELETVDEWRAKEPDQPSRPEAIRRLCTIALKWRRTRS